MSSLPQGWHGIPVPTRNSVSTSASATATVPTTIRKKWNSPLSSEVPRSKLPAYKPLAASVRLQKSSINNTLHARSTSKSSIIQDNSTSSLATKELKNENTSTKELKNEISNLKKELNTVKTENCILKVKVRRVDDENIQKSRQIEKLRVELKAAQKNKTTDNKKSKESELLLLRQKCLRLEGALKEKDVIFKKIANETQLKPEIAALCSQSTVKESSNICDLKQEPVVESKSAGKSASLARTNILRANLSSKGEVTKLREMIHKLEKENQDLQQQVKDKGEEIKRLKLHLRSRNIKSAEAPVPKFISKISTNSSKSTLPNYLPERKMKETTTPSKSTSSSTSFKISSSQNIAKKLPKSLSNGQKKSDSSKKGKNISSAVNGQQRVIEKQVNERTSKLLVTRPGSTFIASKPSKLKSESSTIEKNNIEYKIEHLRENIAAKKIQRSWRNHRKQIFHKEPDQIEKDITFIATSLKYHKMRKDKLNFAGIQRQIIPNLKDDDESAIIQAIQAATKNMWEKESLTAN